MQLPDDISDDYPGNNASKDELAKWLAKQADKHGLPPELPVMASLVESGVKNLNYGDADSVGFFQMRVGIWNQGAYKGYPEHPELQAKWFIDQALAVKKKAIASGDADFGKDPSKWGEWIADIERPAEQYRGRYQLRLREARGLIEGVNDERPGRGPDRAARRRSVVASRPRRRRRPGLLWLRRATASASRASASKARRRSGSASCCVDGVFVRRRVAVVVVLLVDGAELDVSTSSGLLLGGLLLLGLEGRHRAADLDAGHRGRSRDLDGLGLHAGARCRGLASASRARDGERGREGGDHGDEADGD